MIYEREVCDLLSIKDVFKINMLNRRSVPFNAGENDGQAARHKFRESRADAQDFETRGRQAVGHVVLTEGSEWS